MHCQKDVPIFVSGNKADLVDQRVVSYEQGKSMSESIGAKAYFETSAKSGENIEEMFNEVIN